MKEYTIKTAAGETTVLLSDEDAKARGLTAPQKAKVPANKQVSAPANKAAGREPKPEGNAR